MRLWRILSLNYYPYQTQPQHPHFYLWTENTTYLFISQLYALCTASLVLIVPIGSFAEAVADPLVGYRQMS